MGAMPSRFVRAVSALAVCLATGCRSVGPPRTVQDRFDYAEALSRSWKEQMLLNLVKLRYADAPVFLDVASVISQYSLQGQLTAGGQFPGVGGNSASVGGTVQWADKPTITFQPLTGQKFTKSLLTPIAPAAVMDLVQAGWPVDLTFRVAVRAVNGIQAGTRNRMIGQAEDPRFPKILDGMRRLQRKGGISVRVEKKDDKETTLLVIGRLSDPESLADREWIAATLGIEPGADRYELVFGASSASRTEIAVLTRSILEILTDLSFDVQVPPEHERDGRVGAALAPEVQKASSFRVLSGPSRPADAFAAVRYEDHWFWIDDRDFPSKRALSFMLVLIALAETGSSVAPPAITISTGS
jgi:hypothetical protein